MRQRNKKQLKTYSKKLGIGSVVMLIVLAIWRFTGYSPRLVFIDIFVFCISFIVMLVITSQFILPVSSNSGRSQALWRFLSYLDPWNQQPILVVKDGELIERRGERHKSGPGVVLVYPGNAIVVQTPTKFVESRNSGVVFLKEKQRLREYLDLRPHLFLINDVYARTSDGIEVMAELNVSFRLSRRRNGSESASHITHPYGAPFAGPLDKAFDAVYRGEAVAQQAETAYWSDLPIKIAVDVWRSVMLDYNLNMLFPKGSAMVGAKGLLGEIEEKTYRRLTTDSHYKNQINPFMMAPSQILERRGIEIKSVNIQRLYLTERLAEEHGSEWRRRWEEELSEQTRSADWDITQARNSGRNIAQAAFAEAALNNIDPFGSHKQISLGILNTIREFLNLHTIGVQLSHYQDVFSHLQSWIDDHTDHGDWIFKRRM